MSSSEKLYSGELHSLPIGKIMYDNETRHHSLLAVQDYNKGDMIISFSASSTQETPDRFTVQLSKNKHIVLAPDYLKYLNHSCDPNCYINVDNLELIALHPIHKGDELTFFYPSTEWDMSEPFHCNCGTTPCLQKIQGAAYIPLDILNTYKLSSYIQQKIKAK
jgi:hypothetical protein